MRFSTSYDLAESVNKKCRVYIIAKKTFTIEWPKVHEKDRFSSNFDNCHLCHSKPLYFYIILKTFFNLQNEHKLSPFYNGYGCKQHTIWSNHKVFLNIRTFETNFLVHLRHWNSTANHLLRRNIERYISVLFVTLDIIRINQTSYSWTFPTSTRIYLCPYWNERICSSTLFWQKFEYSSKFGCHIRFNEDLFVWNKKVLVYIQDFWTLFECFCVRLNYSLVSIMHFG